jgi:hypothetical protein
VRAARASRGSRAPDRPRGGRHAITLACANGTHRNRRPDCITHAGPGRSGGAGTGRHRQRGPSGLSRRRRQPRRGRRQDDHIGWSAGRGGEDRQVLRERRQRQGRRGPHRQSTAKHYAGDGDTEYDQAVADANEGKPWWAQRYTIDQGITVSSREDFARIDLAPYVPAVHRHDVGSVMPWFSSVDWTEDGVGNPIKMHAHRELITDVLKGQIGFDGFLISDRRASTRSPTQPSRPTRG